MIHKGVDDMTTYAYIRVSTDKQDYIRQIGYLNERGYNKDNCTIYEETYTGTKKSRPEWDKLLATVEKNDTIVVESLSRIGRSLINVIETIMDLVENKQVNLIIFKEGFNFRANGNMDATTKLMLNLLASFVQFERDINSERSKEKLQELKRQGVKLGRPVEEKRSEIAEMLREGKYNVSEIAFMLETSRAQVYRVKKELGL